MSAYCPFGLSLRQLNILAEHTEIENIPLPVRQQHIHRATWSLIDKGYLRFHHQRHTCITRKGREHFWMAMEVYIRLAHRAMDGEKTTEPPVNLDALLVWIQTKGYAAAIKPVESEAA